MDITHNFSVTAPESNEIPQNAAITETNETNSLYDVEGTCYSVNPPTPGQRATMLECASESERTRLESTCDDGERDIALTLASGVTA